MSGAAFGLSDDDEASAEWVSGTATGVLVLWPTAWGGLVAPGSTSLRADCGHHCIVSPVGRAGLDRNPGMRTRCKGCVDVAADDTLHVPPDVRQELSDWLGVAVADQAVAHLHDRTARRRRSGA